MAIFNSYVKLPEGTIHPIVPFGIPAMKYHEILIIMFFSIPLDFLKDPHQCQKQFPHFEWIFPFPDAPCMVYLPTQKSDVWGFYVDKYDQFSTTENLWAMAEEKSAPQLHEFHHGDPAHSTHFDWDLPGLVNIHSLPPWKWP